MTRLKTGTHVVVADSEKALILENVGDSDYPHLKVEKKKTQDNPPTQDQAANRPGRFNDGPSVHRSSVGDTDWHELAKDRFAAELADLLYERVHAGKIDRLILVASPHVLGELRDQMHQEVSDIVVAEIDKTLTNHTLEDVEKIILSELKSD